MSNKRQFLQMYQDVVAMVKEIKVDNDIFNKAIGVGRAKITLLKIKSEQRSHQQVTQRIALLLGKLEQSYLDPDTARKIGTVKQQYRIQKDRRVHILQSLEAQALEQGENVVDENIYHPQYSVQKQDKLAHRKENSPSKQSQLMALKENMYEQREQDMTLQLEHQLMGQRGKQLNEVSRSLSNVHHLYQETQNMLYGQGEQLNIISDEIFSAKKNVEESKQNLLEANQSQKKARRKYIIFSCVVLCIAVAMLLLIFL